MPTTSCCGPSREGSVASSNQDRIPQGERKSFPDVTFPWKTIPAGTFAMGNPRADGHPNDGEEPVHPVTLPEFEMAATTVSNAEFATFVAATGYVTDAERFGWSFVFAGLLPPDFPPTRAVEGTPWWRQVYGAVWNHPEGPGSSIDTRVDHPVVHVSWNDAQVFCDWSTTRLPTEQEWEYAARGGSAGTPFWWGKELIPKGKHAMNVWQGSFPDRNSRADGYMGTCPVKTYRPNAYGLFNVTGNVWEWCADWFDPSAYQPTSPSRSQPPGDSTGRVMRGGSYLCHASYCNRYRVDARSSNTPDSSAGNIGFRVARSLRR